MSHKSKGLIQRYNANERTNHWITAITFVLLALSGLALFHPAFFWLTNLLGGGVRTRILHPFLGLVMFISFSLFARHLWTDNKLKRHDVEWALHLKDVLTHQDDKLPAVGKYNGGQKLLYCVLVLCMISLLVSGFIMWRAYFSVYFPITVIRAATLLHAASALALICAIIVHIYAAIWVKGSFTAMMRGTVTPGWAWKHHRLWFRRVRKGDPD